MIFYIGNKIIKGTNNYRDYRENQIVFPFLKSQGKKILVYITYLHPNIIIKLLQILN